MGLAGSEYEAVDVDLQPVAANNNGNAPRQTINVSILGPAPGFSDVFFM
jgi:hypothetical protein